MANDDFIGGDEFDPEVLDKKESAKAQTLEVEEDAVLRVLERRRLAYTNVFKEGKRTQGDVDVVLNDLFGFCRAGAPTYNIDDGIHADTLMKIKEGRREVFNRIRDFSGLSLDALLFKYTDQLTK